jgi:hypothetical protein
MRTELHVPAALLLGRTSLTTEIKTGWTLERSGDFGNEKSLFSLPGFEPRTAQPVVCFFITATLLRLLFVKKRKKYKIIIYLYLQKCCEFILESLRHVY